MKNQNNKTNQQSVVKLTPVLHNLLRDKIQTHKQVLYGKLATFIESLGGNNAVMQSRKDIISDIVHGNNFLGRIVEDLTEYGIVWYEDKNASSWDWNYGTTSNLPDQKALPESL